MKIKKGEDPKPKTETSARFFLCCSLLLGNNDIETTETQPCPSSPPPSPPPVLPLTGTGLGPVQLPFPFPSPALSPSQTLIPEFSLPMKWRSVSAFYSSHLPAPSSPVPSSRSPSPSSRSLSSSSPRFYSRCVAHPFRTAGDSALHSPFKPLDSNGHITTIHDVDEDPGDGILQMNVSCCRAPPGSISQRRRTDDSNQHCRSRTTPTIHRSSSEEKHHRVMQRHSNIKASKKRKKKDHTPIRLKVKVGRLSSASRMRDGDDHTGSSCIAEETAEAGSRYLPRNNFRGHTLGTSNDAILSDMDASSSKDSQEPHTRSLVDQEETGTADSGALVEMGVYDCSVKQRINDFDMLDSTEKKQGLIKSFERADMDHCICTASCSDTIHKEEFGCNKTSGAPKKLEQLTQLVHVAHVVPKSTEADVAKGIIDNNRSEESGRTELGEVKHFYTRRNKQTQMQKTLCTAPEGKDGKRMHSSPNSLSQFRGKASIKKDAMIPQKLLSLTKGVGVCSETGNFNVRDPSLPVNLLTNKSNSLNKNSVRLSRELVNLVSNGCLINPEIVELNDGVDSSSFTFPARKKRKIQKVNDIPTVEDLPIYKTKLFPKEGHAKWRSVNLDSADPTVLIGCKCKVYWPDDKDWYCGVIKSFDSATGKHHVQYNDGDTEDLILSKELVKLSLSREEMLTRNIVPSNGIDESKRYDYQEMAVLATVMDNFQEEFGHGELVWAKIKGHPMWPAFVMDEKHANACGLYSPARECTVAVQFFGSYDYARISSRQALAFSVGLSRKLYTKCKKASFGQGIIEAERYMREGKLPQMMANLQEEVLDSTSNASRVETCEGDEDCMGDERIHKTKKSVQSLLTCPIDLGDLQVLSLGKIVRDSEYFHNENHIWTEGYTAIRKFPSIKDPERLGDYKMEVFKDPRERTKPLFIVTLDNGDLVEGATPSMCWRTVNQKLEKVKEKLGLQSERKRQQVSSGDVMFGFTNPQISKLIQALPYARACFKFTGWLDKKATDYMEQLMPAGYKPVEVDWKHADRCSVCGLDEEYTTNLFLQCDKCRVLVHMYCYGESEPPNGRLWLCQLCRLDGPLKNPLCCLCPVQGGAIKKTTDGRWAHLTCAMWIPETCFVDVKHMEPIDGLRSINKERWKLTCSICKVPYGVCIQCSDPSCYVAYHVLCARSSGFVLEVLEDPSHKQRGSTEDLEHSVRLLSYCKRHRQPKVDRDTHSQQVSLLREDTGCLNYCPPPNSSGCARTEPYNCATRRGRQEPEVRAAASAKRLYVEKMPYRVSGFCRQDKSDSVASRKFSQYALQVRQVQKRKASLSDTDVKAAVPKGKASESIPNVVEDFPSICSVSDRYHQMRTTLKHRLAFGKSAIHGWGVFTKQSHRAGDMVIEYAGEMVRPVVADLRERLIYNTLVGAGTYMFRIDDERVVDATRAGSIAHLINHSCEPNCFSRVVTISGEEHIIIFAKRDIDEGEELSYDYRFASKGEQLECFCGVPACRGFVNLDEADEEPARILVPTSELAAWIPSIS